MVFRVAVTALAAWLSLMSGASAIQLRHYQAYFRADASAAEVLLMTIGESYSWANAALSNKGQDQLYCQPDKLSMNAGQYQTIFDRYLLAHPPKSDEQVELLMLLALADVFPCQG